jgi:TonB family protein
VKKLNPPPFANKETMLSKNEKLGAKQPGLTKPQRLKPDIISVKKRIILPPIGTEKIKNPSYLSYYQLVREKIKHAAYQNYSITEEGEVYLSFVISSAGAAEKLNLIENKSSSSKYLKQIALKSLKDAADFPAFPKELDYPRLSFNVVISFEID